MKPSRRFISTVAYCAVLGAALLASAGVVWPFLHDDAGLVTVASNAYAWNPPPCNCEVDPCQCAPGTTCSEVKCTCLHTQTSCGACGGPYMTCNKPTGWPSCTASSCNRGQAAAITWAMKEETGTAGTAQTVLQVVALSRIALRAATTALPAQPVRVGGGPSPVVSARTMLPGARAVRGAPAPLRSVISTALVGPALALRATRVHTT